MAFAMKNIEDMMENVKWAPGRSVSPCISETEVHETVGKKLSKTTSRQKSEVKGKVIDEKLERREQKQWIAIKNFENNFNNEANEFFITNIDEDLSSASDDFKKALEGVNVFGGSPFFAEYNPELLNHVVKCRGGESEEDKLTNNCCTQNEVSTSTEVSVSGSWTGVRSTLHRDTCCVSLAEFKLLDKLEQKGHYPLPLQGSNDTANSSAIPLSELLKFAKLYGLQNKMLLFSVEDHKECWSLKHQNPVPFEIIESVSSERFADYLQQNDFSHQSHINAVVNDECLEGELQVNSVNFTDQCVATIQEKGELQVNSVDFTDQCLANIQEGELQVNSVNFTDQCVATIQEKGELQVNSVNFTDQCLANIQEGELQVNSVNFTDQCVATIQEGELQVNSVNFTDQCVANIQEKGELQVNSVNFTDQCVANIQENGELQVNSVNFTDQCVATIQEKGELQVNSVDFTDQCLANIQEKGEIHVNSVDFTDQCLANIQEGEIQVNSVDFIDQCLANIQEEGELQNMNHQRAVPDINSLIVQSLGQFVTVPETGQSLQQYCSPFQETTCHRPSYSETSLSQNLYSNPSSLTQIHPMAIKKNNKIVPLPSQPDNLTQMIRQSSQNHDVSPEKEQSLHNTPLPSEIVKQRLKRKLTTKNEGPELENNFKTMLPNFELIQCPSNENEQGTASKKRRKVKK